MIVEDAAEDELEFNYLCLKSPSERFMESHTHCVNHLEKADCWLPLRLLQPADTLQLFSGH